ncbi:MAG: hypothetical protein P8M18_03905 [Woeseiaceae bacterium]|nr:hypothetical protein [Woeseiaceae bacterium]
MRAYRKGPVNRLQLDAESLEELPVTEGREFIIARDERTLERECRIHDIGRSRGQRPLSSLYLPGGFLST